MVYVKWFKDISKDDVNIVGGKGANLGEMSKLNMPVPPGFVLTVDAYWKFVNDNNIYNKIKEILSKIDINNPAQLRKASNDIQDLFIHGNISEDLKNEILNNYKELSKIFNEDNTYVAVRSSATAEDMPNASFAGEQATYLNVKGENALLDSVKKCWASLWTARAINYRSIMNFSNDKVALAVVIQKQIFSKKSGVMFTAEPVNNDISKIIIEASWGLGEAIVSGEVIPDEYIVDKNTLQILNVKINQKKIMTVYDPDSLTKNINVSQDLQNTRCLSDDEIRRLAEYGKALEQHYGRPQDIEFAIDDNIYIVQTRAITTINNKVKDNINIDQKILLKGIAASPGIGTGKVKIIRSMDEFNKFEVGDILVTKMTNPDYEPLMAKASGIITDEGGHLSHAAIVSRELGKPAVVGTQKATELLKDGDIVTVDGTHGVVYEGKINLDLTKKEIAKNVVKSTPIEISATKIMAIADYPETISKVKDIVDGIGLLRMEFLVLRNRKHPRWYLDNNRLDEFTNMIEERLEEILRIIYPKTVIVRTLDMRTDEYKNLEGGEKEPIEANPMIGWHGIRRDLDQDAIFRAEIRAFKKLIKEKGFNNLWIMLPFVISWEEVYRAKQIIKEEGLIPGKDVKVGIMVETPAGALTIEDIIKNAGIDFISFGTNDLTQLTLGVDRNNELVQKLMDEGHPAVLELVSRVISICKKYNVYTSLCGQAGSRPDYAEKLVRFGIDSISVNVDAIELVREVVLRTEKKILLDSMYKYNK
ncbi:Phosphoenolpyruvate synthase [Nanobdella aerobiophila]|uniref:Phosphoenolpyruvate synthase n=1 Tax=Nanobdella aerobiophila TaxID=2586965 RepID=A0A915SKN2_9ARCH|nr:phosphoenolpyruvate synthase [Nanobdella aerobiophila]BBL45758.1 Phosphoenolpyruvate synthase [Nanobdella aerobiophila]